MEKKSKTVSSKREIEEFHREFIKKAENIHNSFILPKLHKIDGYLRGIYKQYEK